MRPTEAKTDEDSLAFVYVLSIGAATMSELGNVDTSYITTDLILRLPSYL